MTHISLNRTCNWKSRIRLRLRYSGHLNWTKKDNGFISVADIVANLKEALVKQDIILLVLHQEIVALGLKILSRFLPWFVRVAPSGSWRHPPLTSTAPTEGLARSCLGQLNHGEKHEKIFLGSTLLRALQFHHKTKLELLKNFESKVFCQEWSALGF